MNLISDLLKGEKHFFPAGYIDRWYDSNDQCLLQKNYSGGGNMKTKQLVTYLTVVVVALSLMTTVAMAKGRPSVEETINNLSFPAIAVDGFGINTVPESSFKFTEPYTGDYPGLTENEIFLLEASGPWYPQKTVGNEWQAGFLNKGTIDVTYIDWGDNIESLNPKIRRPFRLEVTLYKDLRVSESGGEASLPTELTAYTMAVLEFPSSSNELQGTNQITYFSSYATVVSTRPKLVIQYFGDSIPEPLTWEGTTATWVGASAPVVIPVSFAPELNVGGKYIFGASGGGWKPDKTGWYRLTFYIATSGVSLETAKIGNYSDGFVGEEMVAAEGDQAATPVVDANNNLTYVDVLVIGGGGGGRR